MPKIYFLRPGRTLTAEPPTDMLVPERVVDAEAGGRLLDICDAALIDVPFGCRTGACGTCLVEVIAGAQYLAGPSQEEQAGLLGMGGQPRDRLACLVEVAPGAGTVQIVLPTVR